MVAADRQDEGAIGREHRAAHSEEPRVVELHFILHLDGLLSCSTRFTMPSMHGHRLKFLEACQKCMQSRRASTAVKLKVRINCIAAVEINSIDLANFLGQTSTSIGPTGSPTIVKQMEKTSTQSRSFKYCANSRSATTAASTHFVRLRAIPTSISPPTWLCVYRFA